MNKKMLTPIRYVYLLFTIGISALILSLIFSKGNFLENIVYTFSYFADFFDHVRRFYLGLNNVYFEGMHASFPPLAYCIYYLISCILYKNNVKNPYSLQTSPSGVLIVSITIAILAVFFVFATLKFYEDSNISKKKLMSIMLLLSYPFWLAIERGNMSLLVLIILMYAFAMKNSEKKVERELAILLFAIAFGLKLYPAIFGVIYLSEKRYKEALRLTVYGLLFFFVPFIFFQGTVGFLAFYRNITAVGSGATGVTITGICGRISTAFGMSLTLGHQFGKILSFIYFIIVVLICSFKRTCWKNIALLTSLMIIFVPASGTYCLVYWTIPFIYFMNEMNRKKNYCKMDYLYATLFSLVFISYPIQALGSSGMLYIFLYILLLIILLEQFLHFNTNKGLIKFYYNRANAA